MTLVISGEPGIGKTALLEMAKHRADERGVSVLNATGVLAEVHLPFAALEQALRPLMKRTACLAPRQRSALLAAFGMHEIAFRANDTNTALYYASVFFSNAVPSAVEIPLVRNRVIHLGGTLPGQERGGTGRAPKK